MEADDFQLELDRVLADYVPGSANSVSAAQTTTYKGVAIPANSALLKHDTQALVAYKNLIADNENNGNGKVPSIIDAQLSALPLFITAPDSLSFNVQLLINTLPVLDNLATQILRIIARGPYQKVMELVSNRESSYAGIAFSNLVELFETTKRVYNSEESPFFTVENVTFGLWRYGEPSPSFLRGREDTIEGTLRKVNLSTFLLATLGLIDLGFFFLNEAFLDVFCPPQNLDPAESLSNIKQHDTFIASDASSLSTTPKTFSQQRASTKFLKAQALLYLELKTQAYISALELGDRSKEEIISDLFPDNLPEIILRRRDQDWKYKLGELNGGKLSNIIQHGDVQLDSQIINKVKVIFTPAEYDFLQRCTIRKATLLSESKEGQIDEESLSSLMEKYEWVRFLNDLLDYVSKNVGFLIWGPKGKVGYDLEKKKPVQIIKTNSDVSEVEIKNIRDSASVSASVSESENSEKKKRTSTEAELTEQVSEIPQEAPKPKRSNNRPTTFRRVWTEEEESALREGLKLKGTQWTAILELYGPGGQINESLKNRTSLQLKDKARNWKIWYLKNRVEVPAWLKGASGATRGGVPGVSVSASVNVGEGGGSGVGESSRISTGAAIEDSKLKGSDIPKTDIVKKDDKNVEMELEAALAQESTHPKEDVVSEDQYDAMLSLLAKSADSDDVNEPLTRHLVNDLVKPEDVDDLKANVESKEGDEHAELKNLVAQAFK